MQRRQGAAETCRTWLSNQSAARARDMGQLELQMHKFSTIWVFVLTLQQLQAHIHWCIWQLKLAYLCLCWPSTDTSTCAKDVKWFLTRLGRMYLCIVQVHIHAMNRNRHHRFRFWLQILDLQGPDLFLCEQHWMDYIIEISHFQNSVSCFLRETQNSLSWFVS